MTASNYPACLEETLRWEGGDSNHPDDPGKQTRWGITQATYDGWRKLRGQALKSVFTMTRDEMLAIYKVNYWDKVGGDTLAPGVDLATWDYGVNSGVSRARKALMKAIGGPSVDTIKRICAERLSFVRGLKTWKTFGKGWSRRIAGIEAKAWAMAGASVTDLENEVASSTKTAENHTKTQGAATGGVVVSGTGATVSAGVEHAVNWGAIALGGLFVLMLLAVVYAAVKGAQAKDRAAAFRAVANGEA